MDRTQLEEKLSNLPVSPGVYLMKDAAGEILYVGKAKNLRSRVQSYFREKVDRPKTALLVRRIRDVEWIITDTETEALILELNLIKEHRPRYNILMIDDKHYPYLKINVKEDYPRVEVVRRRREDGARYFGPYTSSLAMNEVLRIIESLFLVRTCSDGKFGSRTRPCLNYQIRKCLGPCMGYVSPQEYRKGIEEILMLLEGKTAPLLSRLRKRMEKESEELNFEEAARLRDQMQAVESLSRRQKVVTDSSDDRDVLALVRGDLGAAGQIFFVRNGRVIGRDRVELKNVRGMEDAEIMASFIQQYYNMARDLPGEILVSVLPADQEVLEDWLGRMRGKKVVIRHPRRGQPRRLVDMVMENARLGYEELNLRRMKEDRTGRALQELADALDLPAPPGRIECYDISNISGTNTVASMVVFEDGMPRKNQYRRFRIRTVEGPNDFASMEEVLTRRFGRLEEGDVRFGAVPDLVIIDGGKGQLSSARKIMKEHGAGDIPTFGLAKKEEELFREGTAEPVVLPRDSEALYLVQRIRDEAHRFAITFHRKLRGQEALTSVLDSVPGIGPKRKKILLNTFGSPAGVRQAPAGEIARALGISLERAEKIKDDLG